MLHLNDYIIYAIISRLCYDGEVHYGVRSFWVMTRVRRPYLAKSEHAYVMKSESIEDIFG